MTAFIPPSSVYRMVKAITSMTANFSEVPSTTLITRAMAETHAEGRHAQQIHHDNTQIDRMNPHCAGDYTYLVLRPTLFFGLRRRTRPRLASLARTSAVLMVRPCLTAISPFLIMPA